MVKRLLSLRLGVYLSSQVLQFDSRFYHDALASHVAEKTAGPFARRVLRLIATSYPSASQSRHYRCNLQPARPRNRSEALALRLLALPAADATVECVHANCQALESLELTQQFFTRQLRRWLGSRADSTGPNLDLESLRARKPCCNHTELVKHCGPEAGIARIFTS